MDVGSVSSVPSSVSGSSARSTPVPHSYKPITASASLLAIAKTPDEDIKRRSSDELLGLIRRLESENRHVISEHSSIMKDVNKKMQILLLEVRGLKEVNQNLLDDNQELRDLCCFLDDDRQRGRKLAKEWQRFGRYTASVMRSEVSAYQEKLKELEGKQQELISDNLNLKELCLYLDQERLRATQPRDEGDGSSSSTAAGNDDHQTDIELVPIGQLQGNAETNTADYIRQLEHKVRNLENEKLNGTVSQQPSRSPSDATGKETPQAQVTGTQRIGPDGTQDGGKQGTSPHKPEAVVHAMKVLEVHENLERPQTSVGEESGLDDKEKAIVREMCNVVWRKLGSVKADQQQERAAQSPPVYENLQPSRSKSAPPEASPLAAVKSSPSAADNIYPPGYHNIQQRQDQSFDARSAHSSDGKRSGSTSTGYAASPGYMDPGGLNPPPGDYQYQGQGQYPTQQGTYAKTPQGYRGPPNVGSAQPKYGYVQNSRSTPVTPTPQHQVQQMGAYQQQGPRDRREPHSHSPAPVRRAITPKGNEMMRSQSPVKDVRSSSQPQYPNRPADYQQAIAHGQNQVYQNHPPQRADNSYENIPGGYYHMPAQGQMPSASRPRAHESVSSSYDYHTSSSHLNQSNDYYGNTAYQVSNSGNVQRSVQQSAQSKQPQQRLPPSQTQYQNMPIRNPTPIKPSQQGTMAPGSPRYSSQPHPSQPTQSATLPQFSVRPSHNQPPVNPAYSSAPQSRPQPSGSQPPGYNAPPSYHDRRTSYVEPRESTHGYQDRRDPRDQYYKK